MIGFVADQNGNAGRLYPGLAALRSTAYMKDAIEQAGAVLLGFGASWRITQVHLSAILCARRTLA